MRSFLMYALVSAFIFVGCSEKEILVEMEDAVEKEAMLSYDALMMDNAAKIITQMIKQDYDVVSEITDLISMELYDDDVISFADIFFPVNNEVLKSAKHESPKFATMFKNALGETENLKGSNDLMDFLTSNDFYIYCPYPVKDYPEGYQNPTITWYNIENVYENIGYELQSDGTYKEVLVNDDYVEIYPVWIIKPIVPGKSSCYDLVEDTNHLKASNTVIHEVRIQDVYVTSYCGLPVFEGKLDMRILRSKTADVLSGDTWTVTGGFSNAFGFDLKRKYVRYAKNGWQKGWYTVNTVWDTNWSDDKTQQVFSAYEEDPSGKVKVSGVAKFTTKKTVKVDNVTFEKGSEVGVNCEAEFKTRNGFFGTLEWNRAWFYKTQTQGEGAGFRNSLPIRPIGGDLKITTSVRTL